MHEKEIQVMVLGGDNFNEQLADLGRMLGYSEKQIADGMKRLREEESNEAVQKGQI